MNNTKLEVVRINEDVIATSCSNPGHVHFYISNVKCDGSKEPTKHNYGISYNPDGTKNDSGCINYHTTLTPGWYYSEDTYTLIPCNGSHNNYVVSGIPDNNYECDLDD